MEDGRRKAENGKRMLDVGSRIFRFVKGRYETNFRLGCWRCANWSIR